jgi:peptide-methionine (S)-S-oxide reductase
VDAFFTHHDPTTLNRQGPDRGTQYRSAIFYHDEEQRAVAEAAKERWNRSGRWRSPIVTEVTPASTFYRAEEYHQRYLEKHGLASCHLP